jgi:type I restriction enzyme S subunit
MVGRTIGPSLFAPEFPPEWERRSLWDTATWQNGLAFRDFSFAETGLPIIKIAELKSGITDKTKRTCDVFDERYRVRSGDVLYSWSGSPETSLDVFVWHGEDGWLNQHIFKVTTAEGVNRNFHIQLLRYLRPNLVAIAMNKQTTGLGHVTQQDLRRLMVGLPPLAEQRAIAHILGTLDDKIELNRRMNETLEAMARALFKSWFVDFDPVRAKAESRTPSGMDAETAKLFPSEFVDSELGPIPNGWQIGNIADVATNRRDTVHAKDVQPGIVYVGLEHLPRARLFFEETGTSDDLKSLKVQFSAGEVLFGKLRPYFKKVAVAPCEGICSTDILVLSPRPNANAFVALLAASDPLIEHAVALSDGTRMPRTCWEQLTRFSIAVPPDAVLRAFDKCCIVLFRRAEAARQESLTLARLRDELLPRLLSGEVSVAHAEREVGAVA